MRKLILLLVVVLTGCATGDPYCVDYTSGPVVNTKLGPYPNEDVCTRWVIGPTKKR